jgi:cytochrome c biogenesis protein CcmG, thiol:disulfide interchange protein DsbE
MHETPATEPTALGRARGRFSRRTARVAGGLILGAGLLAVAYLSSLPVRPAGSDMPSAGAVAEGLQVGQAAPDFLDDGGTPLLVDLDGRPIHLADFAGRPLWIVFWATWCTPCQQEAPAILAAFHARAGADLAVLAIDLQEPTSSVRDYVRAHELDYAIGLDPRAAVRDLYRAGGLPSHLFIDATGVIRARYAGQMTAELMDQYLAVIAG